MEHVELRKQLLKTYPVDTDNTDAFGRRQASKRQIQEAIKRCHPDKEEDPYYMAFDVNPDIVDDKEEEEILLEIIDEQRYRNHKKK